MRRVWLCVLALVAACGGERAQLAIPVHAQALFGPGDIMSYELWILDQAGSDGASLSCDLFVTRTMLPNDPTVRRLIDPVVGNGAPDRLEIERVPVGDVRIILLFLYDQEDASGRLLGIGCAQSVTVVGGRDVDVTLEVGPPPPLPTER